MDAEEKAKELVETMGLHFGESYGYNLNKAKQCALIAVDEMLSLRWLSFFSEDVREYWQQVKEEINKL